MNTGTTVSVTAQPNGDLTIKNEDGTITVRKDGSIAISTLAPIELTGETLGKLDEVWGAGGVPTPVINALAKRGRR